MNNIINKVKQYIASHQMMDHSSKIIVGVSGGADSMALLDILLRLDYNCIAAHCNFHLRGDESNRDYAFVKEYCETQGISFISVDFDTYTYMKENGISLEMAARELRYNWFSELLTIYQANRIAVAHHQNDSIETVLINLIRGTGIRGLTGIAAINHHTIRPFLCLTRDEIIQYLSEQDINYITDSTNNEDIFLRNKIRLHVLPLLKTLNPSVEKAIATTSENLADTELLFSQYMIEVKKDLFFDNKIDIEKLKTYSAPETILFEILYPFGFNKETVHSIFLSIQGQSGKTFHSPSYQLIKDRTSLILNAQSKDISDIEYFISEMDTKIETPIKLVFETIDNSINLIFDKNPKITYIDKATIQFPLKIRKWKQGDSFIPFGMKGRKKLSDYFSDRKFSLLQKKDIWLLCHNDNIIWIIGERADNRIRINKNTKQILKITVI